MSKRTKSFRVGNFMFIEATIWLLAMIWLLSGKFASGIERYMLSRNPIAISHMADGAWISLPRLLITIAIPLVVATMVFVMTKKNKAHFLVTFVATRWSFLIMLALTLSLAF